MKVNVNPFEPWRPAKAAVPRPLHAARPWRPPPPPPVVAAMEEPPFVEPVNPLPRNKPPKPPARQHRPQSRTEQPFPKHPLVSQWAAFALLAVLIILCLDRTGWLHDMDTRAPRLLVLGVGTILLIGMAFNSRRGWYTRLTGMAAALALAAIAAWLVPTPRGVNLWSAYRQVEALRALPAGDVAGYQRGAAMRRLLVEEFPSFAADVSAAEQAWLRRTVDEAVEKADRQLEVDPHAALADLHRLNAELTPLEHYVSVRKDLDAARRRALQACLKTAAE